PASLKRFREVCTCLARSIPVLIYRKEGTVLCGSAQRQRHRGAVLTIEPHAVARRLSCSPTEQNELRCVPAAIHNVRKRTRGRCRRAGFKSGRRGGDKVITALVIALTQSDHGHASRSC